MQNTFHKIKSRCLFIAVCTVFLIGSLALYNYKFSKESVGVELKSERVENQKVLVFDESVDMNDRLAYLDSIGVEVEDVIEELNTIVVSYDPAQLDESRFEDEKISSVENDYFVSALGETVNDPRYSEQWGLKYINIESIWEKTSKAQEKVVAVIDSGVCLNHPDLQGKFIEGRDYIDGDLSPEDEFGHGCAVAGVIGANVNNEIGIAGVSQNIRIMPVRVLDGQGYGTYSDVASGIVFATDNSANVINLSLGGTNSSTILENAVNYALSKGVKIVAAAGNTGNEGALYPAKYAGVISVGSIDEDGSKSSFSNYGSDVDVYAPGRNILSLNKNGDYSFVNGTSFAAPMVSAVTLYGSDYNEWIVINSNENNNDENVEEASAQANYTCDAQKYQGLVKCRTYNGVDFLKIDGNNPYVRFEVVVGSNVYNGGRERVGSMVVNRPGAVAGINTDYFGTVDPPQGTTYKNGTRLGEYYSSTTNPDWNFNSNPSAGGDGICKRTSLAISSSNNFSIGWCASSSDPSKPAHPSGNLYNVTGAGPQFLKSGTVVWNPQSNTWPNGKVGGFNDEYFYSPTNVGGSARQSAAGISGDGRYMLLGASSQNIMPADMASELKGAGAYNAIKLDGGGSTQLFYDGNYIVDSSSNRSVASAIIVYSVPMDSSHACSNFTDGKDVVLYIDKDCVGNPLVPNNTSGIQNVYSQNEAISSIKVQSGWSLRVFDGSNGSGSNRCIRNSMWDLSKDYYTLGNTNQVIDDTISSFIWYQDSNCGAGDVCTLADGECLPPGGGTPTTGDHGIYIADVTIPDDTDIPPNTSFVKTWRLKNTGTTTWSTLYKLEFQYGTQMGGPNIVSLPQSVAPGDSVDVSVTLTAPSSTGAYRGYWKLQNSSGSNFGDLIWIDIDVVSGAIPPSSSGSVKLYSDRNYGGSVIYTAGMGEYTPLNGTYYSMQIPSGWSVVTYLQSGFGNDQRCWYQSEPNLQDHSWQNIRSMKVYNYNYCSGNQKVILYKLANYDQQAGNPYDLGPSSDEPNRDSHSMSVPVGWSVKTWSEDGKHGEYRCWNTSIPNLGDHSWNLKISSIEVFASDVCPSTASYVQLCKVTGQGDCTTIESDIPSLGGWGFGNDTARSIKMAGPWEAMLFEHDNYNGSRVRYGGSQNDIAGYPNNTADPNNPYGTSSIKVRRYDPGNVSMFRGGDYNDGGPFKTDRTLDNLGDWDFDNLAQSIQVAGGYELIVCEHPYFKGVCGRWKGDDPNAYHIGKAIDIPGIGTYLQGKVSSIVVCKDQCGNVPVAASLFNPLPDSNIIPGNAINFQWGGAGKEFMVEISGGNLGSPINTGWITNNQYATTLPQSANAYSWKVKSANEFGEGIWSNPVSFTVKDIPLESLYIIGSNSSRPEEDVNLYGYVNPSDATNLTYIWSPTPKAGQGTSTATYNFKEFSSQEVSLTVSNSAGQITKTFSLEIECRVGEYLAEYFDNKTLSGTPKRQVCESKIDQNWGTGGPNINSKFGDGTDGVLSISTNSTYQTTDSTASGTLGTFVLSATNSSFAAGQKILIHQTRGANAGKYQLTTIASYTAGVITTTDALNATYITNAGSDRAQVLVVKQFTDVTVASGVTLSAKDWDGNTGGIIYFLANGDVNVAGNISAVAKGYRGGAQTNAPQGTHYGNQAEGTLGDPNVRTRFANGNGGGGGSEPDNNGGAGGGHVTSGAGGHSNQSVGGSAVGDANLTNLFFGGGGGGAAAGGGGMENGLKGGDGGGVIMIYGKNINISGSINADGESGGIDIKHFGGGGGAGGSVKLSADILNLGTTQVVARAGSAGGARPGGIGSSGRIVTEYCTSVQGTTSPSAISTQTTCHLTDNFSVRWTGKLNLDESNYNFTTTADDGVRVWVDNESIVDQWSDGPHQQSVEKYLAGGLHNIKYEYYENDQTANAKLAIVPTDNNPPILNDIPDQSIGKSQNFVSIQLNDYGYDADGNDVTWSYSGNSSLGVDINSSNVASITAPTDWIGEENITFTIVDQWGAQATNTTKFKRVSCELDQYSVEYYNNKDLSGSPVIVQCENEISSNWGSGGPLITNKFGDGRDGILNITSDTTYAVIDSTASGTQGSMALNATNASFQAGQMILIHQTRGTNAGTYQITKIVNYSAGVITTADPLITTYITNSGNERAQIIVVKQYTDVTVNSPYTLSAKPWNGNTGGIIYFLANGNVRIDGAISVVGKGFRGGVQTNAPQGQHFGNRGEGTGGEPNVRTDQPNGNGGGGGWEPDNNGGAGGGYASKGANGFNNKAQGGNVVGNTGLTTIFFGGAGGAGAAGGGPENGLAGGNGAGVVWIGGRNITVNGNINADGATGGIDSLHFGGGGGAGGTIYLIGDSVNVGTNKVVARGGAAGGNRAGGVGSVGRLLIDYCSSLQGSTLPVSTTIQSNCQVTDNFSIRWTGLKNFTKGIYKFDYASDDGITVDIDGENLINEWITGNHVDSKYKRIEDGNHLVEVKYFEDTGNAQIALNSTIQTNTAPEVGDIPDQTIDLAQQFEIFDLDDFVTDTDVEDLITWEASGNTSIIIEIDEENLVTASYPTEWIGEETVTFKATDFAGEFDTDMAIFKVEDPNQPPVITSTAITTTNEDVLYTYQIVAEDPDSTNLEYTLPTAPTGMSINSTGLINWTPTNSEVGNHAIVVEVSDGNETAQQSYTLQVVNVNDAPTMNAITGQTIVEDGAFAQFDLDSFANDVDAGDVLTYSRSGNTNLIVNIDANNVVTITSPVNWNGSNTIQFTVKDSSNTTASRSAVYTVTPVNDLPTTPSNPNPTNGSTGVALSKTLSWVASTDADGDTVKYDVYFGTNSASLPKVSSDQLSISYQPSALSFGTTYYWKIAAKDSVGAANGPIWSFGTITNSAPIINVIDPDGINDTSETIYNIKWTDSDADNNALISLFYDVDQLDYNGTQIVSNISEDDETDLYAWNVTAVPVGQYYIYAKINDGVNSEVKTYSSGKVTVQRNICSSVTQISAIQCEALKKVYQSTGGDTWTNKSGWLITNTPCSWYGVVCTGTGVTQLNLNANNLVGTIPIEIGNLTKLTILKLDNNKLTGSIPTQITNLINLTSLTFQNNQLTGSLPATLGNMSKLVTLSAFNNQLSGTIPTSIGSLINATAIRLNDNNLSGAIPTQISTLRKLKTFLLNNNNLSGTIPTGFGGLTVLTNLQIQNNALTGNVPTDFPGMTAMGTLDIGYNGLNSANTTVVNYLNAKDPDWKATQTITPTNLIKGTITSTSIQMRWDLIPYTADGGYYELYYSTTSTGTYTLGCQSTSKTARSCVVSNLVPNTTYYFKVRTYTPTHGLQKNVIRSAFTAVVSGKTTI